MINTTAQRGELIPIMAFNGVNRFAFNVPKASRSDFGKQGFNNSNTTDHT